MKHMTDLSPASINVVVPVEGQLKTIMAGSGIVQNSTQPSVIYYEGNLYRSTSMQTFADLVYQAWGRMDTNYPTIAKQHINENQVHVVATFDPTFGVIAVTDETLLKQWLGIKVGEQLDQEQLYTTNGRQQDLRTVKNWNAAARQTTLKYLPKSQQQKYKDAGLI